MPSQPVYCPNCDTQVPAANINISALMAKCSRCNEVFNLPFQQAQGGTGIAGTTQPEIAPTRPSSIVEETGIGNELFLKYRWFNPGLIFLLFFCMFWDGFLVVWYAIALGAGGNFGGMDIMMFVFPLIHVAVGVALTYYTIAGFFNSTRILIDRDMLYVRHRPIPWFGNFDITASDIGSTRAEEGVSKNNRPQYTAILVTVDGEKRKLLGNVDRDEARYVAHRVAEHLDIPFEQASSPAHTVNIGSWFARKRA